MATDLGSLYRELKGLFGSPHADLKKMGVVLGKLKVCRILLSPLRD